MTTLRPFVCEDMFRFNKENLDPLTETYGLSFYMLYLAHWPEYFQVAESPSGDIMGYIMGKAEGHGENWHGHVTALTVAPEFRRCSWFLMIVFSTHNCIRTSNFCLYELLIRPAHGGY